MNQNSKNGLDLIGIAGQKVNQNFGKVLLGSALYMLPMLVLAFIGLVNWQISVALVSVAIAFSCIFAVGFAKFFINIVNGENAKISTIFMPNKGMLAGLVLSLILIVLYIVGFALFVVPAFIFITFFSMSVYFVANNENITVFEALGESKNKMTGKRTAMFSYKIIFYILYVIVILAYVFGMMAIKNLPLAGAIPAYVGGALLGLFLFAIITMYFTACNAVLFNEILDYSAKRKQAKAAKTANAEVKVEAKEEVKEEAKVEEVPAEKEVKVVKKPAAKKATSTKAVTATKTTATKTAAKPAAAKTAAKKPATKKTTTKKEN